MYSNILTDRKRCSYQSCSRTDKGVSAIGNVASLKCIVPDNFLTLINQHLPPDIRVFGVNRKHIYNNATIIIIAARLRSRAPGGLIFDIIFYKLIVTCGQFSMPNILIHIFFYNLTKLLPSKINPAFYQSVINCQTSNLYLCQSD